jgi:peptidoglycan/xylan/chitin deacetylase (PgdA/CDA1 family)
MKILITLDYELFYENNPKPEDCIIKPMQEILKIVDPLGVKLVLFVDVGYLKCLEKYKSAFPELEKDYQLVTGQMKELCANGHEVQLHIHPHWEDTVYNEKGWDFDLTRYKLSDFTDEETLAIVTEYTEILHRITGQEITSFRAGGWSAQPFEPIGKALLQNGVTIDSTVYPRGLLKSKDQWFDFKNIGFEKSSWKFSKDLVKEDKNGSFLEVAISSFKVLPFFFWRFVAVRLLRISEHVSYSKSSAVGPSKLHILRLLLWPSYSVVAIDGFKARYLENAYQFYKKKNLEDFVIIGHPKAFTPFSMKKFKQFIEKENRAKQVVVFSEYK